MGASVSRGLASCSQQPGPNRLVIGPGFHIWHPDWPEEGDSAGGSVPGPVPTQPLSCAGAFLPPEQPQSPGLPWPWSGLPYPASFSLTEPQTGPHQPAPSSPFYLILFLSATLPSPTPLIPPLEVRLASCGKS